MAKVGKVLVRSSQDLWTKQVVKHCQSWLRQMNWDLLVECSSEVLVQPENFLELTLLPGEEQSNGLLQVTYKSVPSGDEIENILHGWLFHLATDPTSDSTSDSL